MKQSMPVVRQIYWPGVVPQFIAIAILSIVFYQLSLPTVGVPESILLGAALYWLFSFVMRRAFTRDHMLGIKAYRAGKFDESLTHFEKAYAFFTNRPWIDKYRFVLLGTASQNPYRTIALCNMAFAESQLGQGSRAIALYEQALKLTPDCAIAQVALRMLQSTQKA